MRTRMAPKIIRSYLAGSSWVGRLARLYPRMVVPAFRSSFSQSDRPLRTCRFNTVTTEAPRMAPGMEPIPPRITMESTPMDSRKVKDSGLMKTCLALKTAPMAPAKEAPQAKAISFIRTSGTPMACAAGLASIEVIEEENLLSYACALGEHCLSIMEKMKQEHPIIGDVRCRGALMGIELVKDRKTKEPFIDAGKLVYQEAFRNGLAWIPAGHILRMSPPIVMDFDTATRALAIIEEAIGKAERELL